MPLPRFPRRKRDTHKGDYGKVAVVAGSRGMMGAAVLATEAALRSGAGLVEMVVPETVVDVASMKQICAVVRGVPDTGQGTLSPAAAESILRLEADAFVIGPGLGGDPRTFQCLHDLVLRLQVPYLLDADGLNAFQENREILERNDAPCVLTPHPGEASRLLRLPTADVNAEREEVAREIARRFHAVCVLKGHRTVVTDGRKVHINRTGNPGMATGGSGDVLAGVIGGLLGQGLSPWDAARLGVCVHGRAGDIAARKRGEISMIATDILDSLPDAFRSGR